MGNENELVGKSDEIEKRVSKRRRRQQIQNVVLTGIYASAVVGVAITSPNAVQLLKYVQKYIEPEPRLDRRISQAMTRLRARGLITKNNTLTTRASMMIEDLEKIERLRPKPQRRWDRKWRMVIFDIWERRRATRDQLRNTLINVGFVKVQDSVWVYPYPCEELFVSLRAHLRLGRGVLYIVAEEIEHDVELRKLFNLSLD